MSALPTLPIEDFEYKYLLGPFETKEELLIPVSEGNCRRALQLYYFRIHNLFLEKDDIYLPGGYKVLGAFMFKEETIDFDALKEGDVIYAQNLRGKKGQELQKGIENFKDRDEWLYYLHSAVYIGKVNGIHYIWNATSITGGTVVWPLDTFEYYYKPISVKRVLSGG